LSLELAPARGYDGAIGLPGCPSIHSDRARHHHMTTLPVYIPTPKLEPVVFVVDEDASVRDSVESLVRQAGWRTESFGSAEAFLAYPAVDVPRCLVLDVTLPDIDGFDLQHRIEADQRAIPIIFLTGYDDVSMTVRAMRAGAFDFFTKPAADTQLLHAIGGAIQQSERDLLEDRALRQLRDRYDSLTPREREVMELVVAGLLNKHIAGRLGISEITVKAHRGCVMRKMMAASLPNLVRMHAALFD
jgi:FixJ family two-component response regulator